MTVREVLPRDAIPSIDDPEFGPDYFGDADDEVLVLSGDEGPARAYPLRILGGHEIVNDRFEGRPVAETFCPICWSTVVYDRTVEGRELTFGVSGKLADDALVMYDRETESEWKQPTGRCLAGPHEGRRLASVDAPVTTYRRFRERHTDGLVLQPARGGPAAGESDLRAAYDMSGYDRYRDGDEFGLYGMRGEGERRTWDRTDIDAKTVVLGVEVGGEALAYPVTHVEENGGLVTDTVGGEAVLLFVVDDAVGAFVDPGSEFQVDDGVLRGDGTTWDPVTGRAADGRSLDPVRSMRLFAFAWQDAHGPDAFRGL